MYDVYEFTPFGYIKVDMPKYFSYTFTGAQDFAYLSSVKSLSRFYVAKGSKFYGYYKKGFYIEFV